MPDFFPYTELLHSVYYFKQLLKLVVENFFLTALLYMDF